MNLTQRSCTYLTNQQVPKILSRMISNLLNFSPVCPTAYNLFLPESIAFTSDSCKMELMDIGGS